MHCPPENYINFFKSSYTSFYVTSKDRSHLNVISTKILFYCNSLTNCRCLRNFIPCPPTIMLKFLRTLPSRLFLFLPIIADVMVFSSYFFYTRLHICNARKVSCVFASPMAHHVASPSQYRNKGRKTSPVPHKAHEGTCCREMYQGQSHNG